MSVNKADANNGVLIHAGENILLFSDNASIEFSQNDSPMFKGGSKTGRIYLTTHRIIFNSKNMAKESLKSFSAPFVYLNEIRIEQPTFGANYIRGKAAAEQNGGFEGSVVFKVTFKAGGAIEFGQAMSRAAKMAQSNMGSFAPPPYEGGGGAGAWYQAPPPAYTPDTTSYGWLPSNFTHGPDPNTVFMSDVPPPYPGINPNPPPANAGGGYPSGGVAAGGAYPGYPPQSGYSGYPSAAPPYPGTTPNGYPGAPNGYPGAPNGYPGAPNGYPVTPNGYPGAPQGYPQTAPGYPGAPQPYGVYPNLPANSGYPGANPNQGGYGFNPNYNEEKKAL